MGTQPHVYCVAEISANHNGSLERTEAIVRAAAAAGADAVKLQTYTADSLTIPCDNDYFRIEGTLWDGHTLYSLYQEAAMPWEWTARLMALAHSLHIDCFSSPFDVAAVDYLEECGVRRYKIASLEIADEGLLKRVATTGKPVVLSTGTSTLAEIDNAVRILRQTGVVDITLLKCTSAYPAPSDEANLRTLPHMASAFLCPVGISDHTMGSAVAVASVAFGAVMIEKHFTLSRADGGFDSSFSMEPEEFAQLVRDVRTASQALGCVHYGPTSSENASVTYRRSLFVVKDIQAGEFLTHDNVRCIRPGHGLAPQWLETVIGCKVTSSLSKGTPLRWEHITTMTDKNA